MPNQEFPFRFAPVYRIAAVPFFIRPATTGVQLQDGMLRARFGPWRLQTGLDNVAGTTLTGPYGLLRTVGPAHLSLADRGVTFATNRDRGVCITFRAPVRCLDPTGRLRHPALTVTVRDYNALIAALAG